MSASPSSPPPAAPLAAAPRVRRVSRRWLLWGALVVLLLVAQGLLVWLTLNYESARAQDQADSAAEAAATEMRRVVGRVQQGVQSLMWNHPSPAQWRSDARNLLRERRELIRLEWRDAAMQPLQVEDTALGPPPFSEIPRAQLDTEAHVACATATRSANPAYARSYFMPLAGGLGHEVMDLCVPLLQEGQPSGYLLASMSLGLLLEEAGRHGSTNQHELSLVEADGTRLARAGALHGAGIYQATRLVDLPGHSLQLRADAVRGRPGLIPNLAIALVLGLSLVLLGLVVLLARDMRRRSRAESALAESLALRRAMEDSLVTGLRARDADGRITYVNPAFCDMTGYAAHELVGQFPPPYWPKDRVEEYRARQVSRLTLAQQGAMREGFETVFVRKTGEPFPVMIYEAPLLDRDGQHAGWMSAVLDVSAERRMEELSRQQQERLQATARLATVGEMASLLSHELNQPLAAIASYATGSLNLMADPEPAADTLGLLRQATERIAEQAERAGRIIKSVHGFVRRREQSREAMAADVLIEAVLPLIRLQARKSGARIEVDCPKPAPRVLADRTMVEQVLLNLARNGIQAMETATPLAQRVLTLRVRQHHARWVEMAVVDAGPGIPPEVAKSVFTPFFTTREEGMGLGLSLCRTVIEQHGGALDFGPATHAGQSHGGGTEFRFTLPVPDNTRRAIAAPNPTPPS